MRILNLTVILVFLFCSSAAAQETPLPNFKRATTVRVFGINAVNEVSWIGIEDSDIVVQRDGLRRRISLVSIDSIQEFVSPQGSGRSGMVAGAVVGGAALGLFATLLCDVNCTKMTFSAAGIGALLGGTIGRAVGGLVGSVQGYAYSL